LVVAEEAILVFLPEFPNVGDGGGAEFHTLRWGG
jgi:hypothetical protein